MPVKSFNNTFEDLASGDNLSPTQKSSLLTQYNSNISGIQNQLGYKPTYGASTSVSKNAVQIINNAFDTSGNGGRKFVRLDNGWLINAVLDSTQRANASIGDVLRINKSSDNGANWTQLCFIQLGIGNGTIYDWSVVSKGTKIYILIASIISQRDVYSFTIDATTVTNINILSTKQNVDLLQTELNKCSLVFSPTDNTLHATWASKNATYPNSFNIRYAEGTIANDGSVSWGTITQITALNTTGIDYTSPSIVSSNGNPYIFVQCAESTNKYIQVFTTAYTTQAINFNGSTSFGNKTVYTVATYSQSSPSATVDGNGVIHVVWHGKDATDSTPNNIRYSKSTDGGVTWSAMVKLTNGNTYEQNGSSVTCDQNNNLYVYWMGQTSSAPSFYRVRSIIYNGSWGSIADVTTNTTGSIAYPSLCDNLRTFTSPLVIWQDNVTPSVKFSGTWTDTPIIAETVTTSAVSNKELIDKVIAKGIGMRVLGGTVTSSSSTSNFTNTVSSTVGLPTVTVTGLPFKPSTILIFGTSSSYETVYSSTGDAVYNPVAKTFNYGSGSSATTVYNIKADVGPATVTNSGFTLPFGNPSVSVSWIAFG